MDELFVRAIQQLIGKHGWIRFLLAGIARFGYFIYIIYGLVEWIRPGAGRERRRRTLLGALFSVILGSALSALIGCIWCRKRPFVRPGQVENLIDHKATPSFPSNHSALSFAIALRLLADHCRYAKALLALSLSIGLARVYTGVHYLSDVLGGFMLGTACYTVVKGSQRLHRWADILCHSWRIGTFLINQWWKFK